jgi:hypothetical protein
MALRDAVGSAFNNGGLQCEFCHLRYVVSHLHTAQCVAFQNMCISWYAVTNEHRSGSATLQKSMASKLSSDSVPGRGTQNLVRAALVSTGAGTAEMVLSFGGPDTLRFKPSDKVPTNAPISELDGWVPGMASDPKLNIAVRTLQSSPLVFSSSAGNDAGGGAMPKSICGAYLVQCYDCSMQCCSSIWARQLCRVLFSVAR